MGNSIDQVTEFKTLIAGKTADLLSLKTNTGDFLNSDHSLKETKERLEQLSNASITLHTLEQSILRYASENHDKIGVVQLLNDLDLLSDHVHDLHDTLLQDFERQKKRQQKQKIDFVKNLTIMFGVPTIFVTTVESGVGHGLVSVDDAFVLGFAISLPTVFHKSVGRLFNRTAKGICSVPITAQNDFRIYYAGEMIKQSYARSQLCFMSAAKSMSDNVEKTGSRAKTMVDKIFRRRPEP